MNEAVVRRREEAQVLDFAWGRLTWFASGKLGNSAGMTIGCCVIRPGQANPDHLHPNCEEVLHVLSGTIVHYVDGREPFAMGPGDTITIPIGLGHYARNAGDVDAVLMVAFSSADRQMTPTS
jgi:quercetin dioxygenase-like cupin family protein